MRHPPPRRRFLGALAALSFAAGPAGAAALTPVPRAVGYLPWWMAADWRNIPWRSLDRLLLFDSPVQEDGGLLVRDWSARPDVPVDMTLTLFEVGHFEKVFGDQARRARLLEAAGALLALPWLAGVHLDIEGYRAASAESVAGFRQWLAALDAKRRPLGKRLSAFFPASDSFSPYDAAAAQRMDYWVVQLYDAHWAQSQVTGPLVTRAPDNVAAVPRALARVHALGVPRGAMLLSVPLYGWQWASASAQPGAKTRAPGRLLTFAETPAALMPEDRLVATALAREHGLRRDGESTPYYVYSDGGEWTQGWFEDPPSLRAKLGPERRRGYAGLAFFPLGYDQGKVVEAMLRWWRAR